MNEPLEPVGRKWARKGPTAAHLNVSMRTLNNLMAARVVPFIRRKRLVLFDLGAVDEAMARYEVKAIGQK